MLFYLLNIGRVFAYLSLLLSPYKSMDDVDTVGTGSMRFAKFFVGIIEKKD